MSIDFALNWASFIATLIWLYRYLTYWSQVSTSDLPGGNTDFESTIVVEQIQKDHDTNIYILMAVVIGIQWSRAIFAF